MFNQFLPIITSFVVFFFLETFFFYPKFIYFSIALINLLFLFFLKKSFGFKNSIELLNYFILPSFVTLGIIIYSTMLPERFIIQFLFGLNILFIYWYFKNLYLYFNNKLSDHFASLENIFSFGNFLSFFFLSASLYGLYSHLNISIIILLALMLIVFLWLVLFYTIPEFVS